MSTEHSPAPRAEALAVARTLAAATVEVLHAGAGQWLPAGVSAPSLTARTGRGRATYCRRDTDGFRITYGALMVAEKCDAAAAAGWLTTREVVSRGYFGGEPSPLHLLAHTVCHEYAHLLQTVRGWRWRGSVHNQGFYRILDRLHEDGAAARALEYIGERHSRLATISACARSVVMESVRRFRRNDRVGFSLRSGRVVTGRVHRVNRQTVTVMPDRPDHPGQYYRVPPGLLELLDATTGG